jgi:hypothetical protein
MTRQEFFQKRAEFAEVKRQYTDMLQTMGKEMVIESFKPLFDAHPKLGYISWNQYTPYFNDGNASTFGVNRDYPEVEYNDETFELSIWMSDDKEHFDKYLKSESIDSFEVYSSLCKMASAALEHFDDEELDMIFRDHISVTVRRMKDNLEVDTDEYYHD